MTPTARCRDECSVRLGGVFEPAGGRNRKICVRLHNYLEYYRSLAMKCDTKVIITLMIRNEKALDYLTDSKDGECVCDDLQTSLLSQTHSQKDEKN